MRQRGDYDCINLLNKIRGGRINEDVVRTLKWRFLNEFLHPKHVAHVFTKNKPVKRYNETQLGMLKSQLLCTNYRLMNGLVGMFAQFKYLNNEVSVVYLITLQGW